MRISQRLPGVVQDWPWSSAGMGGAKASPKPADGDDHLALARESLRELDHDTHIPPEVRKSPPDRK